MALDKRIPAVYVEIEDRSLATESVESGRSGYVVILSDRGPHNQVIELNSLSDFYDMYGRPDFMKHGQGHYLAEKFLKYSSKLFVVRPALLNPEFNMNTTIQDCMAISNASIIQHDPLVDSITFEGEFTFTNKSNIVDCDSTSLVNVQVGDWIYPEDSDSSLMRQIISIDSDDSQITLDDQYSGPTIESNVSTFIPYDVVTKANIMDSENFDAFDSKTLWHFYAIGAGQYYDNIFIKGVRNTELERMYTDSDGNVLYPNMFMDVAIYRKNADTNTTTMLEGPWSVSLVDRLPGGQVIRDIFAGTQLYLPTVFNSNSKILKCKSSTAAQNLMTISLSGIAYPYAPDVVNRLAVQTIFADGTILGKKSVGSGGFFMQNGSNGNLYFDNGLINFPGNEQYESLIAQAYDGSLKSVDGSIELIVQEIYPWYLFDYVLSGGYNVSIQNAARTLVDLRGDCLLLADTGAVRKSADEDLVARATLVPWNTWNAALYIQYRQVRDINTGKDFVVTPVVHAIEQHLYVDSKYWLAEPVAGIEKGAISESIELSYKANLTKLGDLIEAEMNPVIVEPDGVYILSQFSTWKRLSIMKRLHVVKFVHFLKKRIPTLLKDILQRKASNYWINQASLRTNGLLQQYVEGSASERFIALKSFSVIVNFDDVRSEINCTISITPIRAIERIHVNILVS